MIKKERRKRRTQRSLQLFSHKVCGRNNQRSSRSLLSPSLLRCLEISRVIIGLKAIKGIRSMSKKSSELGTASAGEAEEN